MDFFSLPTSFKLHADTSVQTDLILIASNALNQPKLNNIRLVNAMLTDASLHFGQTNERVDYFYDDLIDPQWRGRTPRWREAGRQSGRPYFVEDLSRTDLPASERPKVLLDARLDQLESLLYEKDIEGRISLIWEGELRYCFDMGHPIESIRLQAGDGQRQTEWTVGPGANINLSANETDWTTVWTAASEGTHQPVISLPEHLRNATRLCLGFKGAPEDLPRLRSLFVQLSLEAPELAALGSFQSGDNDLTLNASSSSKGTGSLLWAGAALTPAAANRPVEQLHITLGQARLSLPQSAVGVPGGLPGLTVAGLELWRPGASDDWQPPVSFSRIQPLANPALPDDWASYRNSYLDNGTWRPLWQRKVTHFEPANLQFQGQQVVDQGVLLNWSFTDDQGQSGNLQWWLQAVDTQIGDADFSGISLRLKVSGAAASQLTRVHLTLPLAMAPQDLMVEHFFRLLAEDRFDGRGHRSYPDMQWSSDHQGFIYRTGTGRSLLAYFETPTAADVRLREEQGRQYYDFSIPLGNGDERITPALIWLAAPTGTSDPWLAADAWANIRDLLADTYASQTGVLTPRPVPTVVWNQPTAAELEQDLKQGAGFPQTGQGWFDRFAQNDIPRAAKAGVRNLILQTPWDNDALHPQYPGDSGHAVMGLEPAPLFGGEAALKRLVEAAHQQDLWITLWYPSALSLFSPLLPANLDWIAWTAAGVPDDGLWGDVVGMDNTSGFADYVRHKISALHQRLGFDGLWIDSWPSLSRQDFANAVPQPQLQAVLDLQAFVSDLGLLDLGIEGTGLLGRTDGYGDYETAHGPPPPPNAQQKREHQRLLNHEYLLYRANAGTYLEMAQYHRALASGGMINIANLDEIDALEPGDKEWLRRINLDHRQALALMQHRRLWVEDGRWKGVLWYNDYTPDWLVFAFEPFTLTLPGQGEAEDISTGTRQIFADRYTTGAWRNLILRPPEQLPDQNIDAGETLSCIHSRRLEVSQSAFVVEPGGRACLSAPVVALKPGFKARAGSSLYLASNTSACTARP